ncbi:nitroreductase family protein [Brytella acorum]|uniref:Putative NAD(P)H nitroreductase n=1 Tax=Brytella acorum TaxID=2959299 RepID=A0AA35XWT6_9PROT|nr:nitroreductase [Brytella acorum]MDF3624569.1 nitroreductase [Brytella acorum]CAI9119582.1 nitroreductase [Brytella acorum]
MGDSDTKHTRELDFLLSRASTDHLIEPAPEKAQLAVILSAALRAPDHGKLRPWRYVVIKGKRRQEFAELVVAAMRRTTPDVPQKKIEKRFQRFSEMPMTIALGMHIQPDGKIPVAEQELAVGAAAMNVLNALHAEGFGAMWVTGEYSDDPQFLAALGFASPHRIAGFLFVGTPEKGPSQTHRPDVEDYMAIWKGEPVSFGADK